MRFREALRRRVPLLLRRSKRCADGARVMKAPTCPHLEAPARLAGRRRRLLGALSCTALLGLGCSGTIGGMATGSGGGTGAAATGGGATSGGAGSSSSGTAGNGATGTGGSSSTTPPDPNAAGLMPLRRLTAREYLNTVRDLLGDTTLALDDVPGESDDLSNNAFPFRQPSVDRHARRGQPAERGRGAREERLHQALDRVALHARERLRRGDLRRPVHHHLRSEGVPAAAHVGRNDQLDDALPDRPDDARARFQRRRRPAHRGDAAGARLHLPLGAGSGRGDQGRCGRAARQLPGGEPPLLFPVGDDARHDVVRRGRGRTAVDRRRPPGAGAAHVAGQQGTEHGRRLHRRLAGRQHARLPTQGSGPLRMWNQDLGDRDGDGVPQLRHDDHPRHRAATADLLTRDEVVGQSGARGGLRRHGRHRHHPQGGDVQDRSSAAAS